LHASGQHPRDPLLRQLSLGRLSRWKSKRGEELGIMHKKQARRVSGEHYSITIGEALKGLGELIRKLRCCAAARVVHERIG
jgi:hypothetical protein